MIRVLFLYITVAFGFVEDIFSQKDSIKSYKLEEITIKADKELQSKIITEINFKEIEQTDAGNISELAKLIPSVKVQTNSRGETLFYLRGAGERQIMLFFDGVPLNIPWDNRIDLSLLPAEAIGNISVTRGIPSVVYGANAISGVININSLNRKSSFSKILFQRGENNSQRYSGLYLNNQNNFSYLFSTSFSKTDGYNLPESYHNSANPSKLRINSFNKSFNFLGKINYHFSDVSNVGLGISYINSEKGVPPETDVSNPRFWKYPIWKRLIISLNGKHTFKNNHAFRQAGSKVEFSFAGTNLKSQIDQFTTASFSNIDDIEK